MTTTRFCHPFAAMGAVEGKELVLVRGEGAQVWDEAGNGYLDATAGLWFANVGHGRAEIADAAARLAADAANGRLRPDRVTESTFARYLYVPEMPDVDLVIRSSGEQRLSNYMIWQAAYAEFVSLDTLWPDFDRRHLWYACELYARRDRRFGGALPNPVAPS